MAHINADKYLRRWDRSYKDSGESEKARAAARDIASCVDRVYADDSRGSRRGLYSENASKWIRRIEEATGVRGAGSWRALSAGERSALRSGFDALVGSSLPPRVPACPGGARLREKLAQKTLLREFRAAGLQAGALPDDPVWQALARRALPCKEAFRHAMGVSFAKALMCYDFESAASCAMMGLDLGMDPDPGQEGPLMCGLARNSGDWRQIEYALEGALALGAEASGKDALACMKWLLENGFCAMAQKLAQRGFSGRLEKVAQLAKAAKPRPDPYGRRGDWPAEGSPEEFKAWLESELLARHLSPCAGRGPAPRI